MDPITSAIYHIEKRPAEGGRMVIVDTEKGEDVVGKEWNVRTAVHEVSDQYGGVYACRTSQILVRWRSRDRLWRSYLLLALERWSCIQA